MMMRLRAMMVVVLAMTAAPGAASACFSEPRVFEPETGKSDAVIVGRVSSTTENELSKTASIYVDRDILGSFGLPIYQLSWIPQTGLGLCPPKGPNLDAGAKVVIYLTHKNGQWLPQRWGSLEEMAEIDDRIR